MFNTIDVILDGRNNIEPTFFINNDVDFAAELQPPSFIDPEILVTDIENSSPAPAREPKLKGKKGVKRPASRPETGDLIEVLTKKWKEDKEERGLRNLQDEERTRQEGKQTEELLGLLKVATQALSRMAEG